MNLGAGRVIYQDLSRIDKSIRRGRVLREPRAGRGHEPLRRRPARPAPGGSGLGGRRPQPPPASGGARRARAAPEGGAAVHPCAHRRSRHRPDGCGRRRGGGRAHAGGRRSGTHRDRHRPLLRDGSRPALGPDRPRVRRADRGCRPHRPECRHAHPGRLRRGHDRRVHAAGRGGGRRRAADRIPARRRRGRVLQLPRRPGAAVDPGPGVRREPRSTPSSGRTVPRFRSRR